MTRHLRRVALTSILIIGFAGAADAHAHLKSASPAMGTTVSSAPTELELSFSEGVDLKFTGVKVTGPAGVVAPTGAPKLGPAGDTTLVVPVNGTLMAGTYKVDWHALATDGHKTNGTYSFTIKP